MKKSKGAPELLAVLDPEDRDLLIRGLRALRFLRGKRWVDACRGAALHGRPDPPLENYGIEEIKALARRLGGEASHWMDWDGEP